MDNRSLAHTKWNCIYHIVFIPKYRRKVMYGKLREDVREILRTLCGYKEVEILEGKRRYSSQSSYGNLSVDVRILHLEP